MINLSGAERHLIEETGRGAEADLGATPATGAGELKQIVRASLVQMLCLGQHPRGKDLCHVQIRGARISGPLDLTGAYLRIPLRFTDCLFEDQIDLTAARAARPIEFIACQIPFIAAQRLESQADVVIERAQVQGTVLLARADIAGSLRLGGTHLNQPGTVVLRAEHVTVGGSVFLNDDFRADGSVQLRSARIRGNLECQRAVMRNPAGQALNAEHLIVDGDVLCGRGFRADGEVCLQWAQVRSLQASGATLSNPDGLALRADTMRSATGVYLDRGFRAQGQVRLVGTEITGELCCTGGKFENSGGNAIEATRCHADGAYLDRGFSAQGEVRFVGARFGRQLVCTDGRFDHPGGNALDADGLICGGDVFLNETFHAVGSVRLIGAQIHRELNCTGATFSNRDGVAINADGLTTPGNIFLNEGFRAEGEVRLARVTVGRQLMCSGGTFGNPIGMALNLSGLVAHGDVLLNKGFRARGKVLMLGASIARDLDLTDGCLYGTPVALEANRLTAGGTLMLLPAERPTGSVDLSSASVEYLKDTPESWPETYKITGFSYRSLGMGVPVDQRIEWLRKARYSPQPYSHLRTVYQMSDRESDARLIAIAGQRDARKRGGLQRRSRVWSYFLDITVGFGYRMHRPLYVLLVLGLLGSFVYLQAEHHQLMVATSATDGGARDRCPVNYPCFQPVVYSFETLLPVINLRQVTYWLPDTSTGVGLLLMSYTWFCIVLGWVLGIAFGAAIGRIFRRELK